MTYSEEFLNDTALPERAAGLGAKPLPLFRKFVGTIEQVSFKETAAYEEGQFTVTVSDIRDAATGLTEFEDTDGSVFRIGKRKLWARFGLGYVGDGKKSAEDVQKIRQWGTADLKEFAVAVGAAEKVLDDYVPKVVFAKRVTKAADVFNGLEGVRVVFEIVSNKTYQSAKGPQIDSKAGRWARVEAPPALEPEGMDEVPAALTKDDDDVLPF